MRSLRGLDSAVAARRLVGLLARRGYSSQTALRVAREVLSETPEGLDGGIVRLAEEG
jgi:regulatory protein